MKSAEKIFDIRTIEKKLENNEITKEEYNKYLAVITESEDFQVIDEEKILDLCGINTYHKTEETESEEND